MTMKKERNTKFSAVVLVLVLIAGILGNFTLATLMSSSVIPTSGVIAQGVYAASGSANDIQAAVNSIASSGGTVHVPAGTFYWNGETVTIPNGRVNIIGASPAGCQGHESNWTTNPATTTLHNIRTTAPMFKIGHMTHGTTANYPVRISGIQFEEDAPASPAEEAIGIAINLVQIPNYRIDHCTFKNFAGEAIFADANDGNKNINVSCYGVIDHCYCTTPYKLTQPSSGRWEWAYGFYSRGNIVYETSFAPVTEFFGKYGHVAGYSIMYVEDCRFSYNRHCTDAIQGGYNVVRYNLMEDPACSYWIGMSCNHGPQPNGWRAGSRGQEVYNNTFIAMSPAELAIYPWISPDCSAFQTRGGASLCYNNDFVGNNYTGQLAAFATLSNGDDPSGLLPELGINQTYIWDNTYTACNFIYNQAPSVIILNTNYFLRAPTQAQDGFIYVPYFYPHPLTLQGTP
jgi:hypothetical protein